MTGRCSRGDGLPLWVAQVGSGEGLLEDPESLGPYSMEGCEVVEAHAPKVVHIVHARFLERSGSRGADGGELSRRFHESDTTTGPSSRSPILGFFRSSLPGPLLDR